MQKLRILIVDDHALFRAGLQMILASGEYVESLHEAATVIEASRLDMSVDLIFLDINMPGLNGLEGVKVLKQKFSNTPIIMLSASSEGSDIQEAIAVGAQGFLHKTVKADDIFAAIAVILKGGTYFPSHHATRGARQKNHYAIFFTARQLEVLGLLCEGKSNKLIACDLNVSENTVRVHVSAILSIFNVSSRSEAMLAAQKNHLINLST